MGADTRISIDVPLDLRRTLRPLGGYFHADGWWRPAHTPEGPVTVHLWRERDAVVARTWGPGGEWALSRLPDLIGLNDAPGKLVTDHPLVATLARRNRGYRFGATSLVFEALLRSVVEQKVAGKEARRSLTSLRARFSSPAPGPRPLRLPPEPGRLSRLAYWEYHAVGIEKRRADVLVRLSRDHGRISGLAAEPPEAARRWLESYVGVGPWTSAETVAVSHGDADAVSVGDYHLKNLVAWHLTGRPRGSDEEMLALLEPFRPHRGRVVRLLETLGHAPAFGPRMPLRSFRES